MDYLFALFLGTVEGMTEFLPISSTGHLILAHRLLGVPETEFWKTFIVVIQFGAILAVLALYGKRLLVERQLLRLVLFAFFPTALIGFVLYPFVKAFLLGSVPVVLWSLLLGGIALLAFEYFFRPSAERRADLSTMRPWQAAAIGCVQAIAIVPGVSRAAATIMGGLLLGVSRSAIVEFSFLLAVPTMLAASGLDMLRSGFTFSAHDYAVLAVGFAGAFLTALAAIRAFLRFVQRHTFVGFGIYRIVVALILFGVFAAGR